MRQTSQIELRFPPSSTKKEFSSVDGMSAIEESPR